MKKLETALAEILLQEWCGNMKLKDLGPSEVGWLRTSRSVLRRLRELGYRVGRVRK